MAGIGFTVLQPINSMLMRSLFLIFLVFCLESCLRDKLYLSSDNAYEYICISKFQLNNRLYFVPMSGFDVEIDSSIQNSDSLFNLLSEGDLVSKSQGNNTIIVYKRDCTSYNFYIR